MEFIMITIIVCLIYGIQHMYFSKHWNRQLQVSLSFQSKGIQAGESCGLEETIRNGKGMPLPTLQVKFRTDASFRFAEDQNAVTTDYYYRRDLFSVGGNKKVTRCLKFRAGQRGYFRIPEVDILVKNFFLTKQYSLRQNNKTALYVYPYKRDTKPFDLLYRQIMGEVIAKQRLEEDPFAFRGIREYRATDPMHRINWKSSARNGSFLVNCFESTTTQTVCVLLDGQTQSVYATRQMQETVISVVSSVAGRLLQSGIPVALYSNVRDILTKEPVRTESGSHRSHMETIDCSLARIDLEQPMLPFVEVIRDTVEQMGNGCCYLVITSNDRPAFRQEYLHQKENAVEMFGIILCEAQEQWESLEGLYPWEVD